MEALASLKSRADFSPLLSVLNLQENNIKIGIISLAYLFIRKTGASFQTKHNR